MMMPWEVHFGKGYSQGTAVKNHGRVSMRSEILTLTYDNVYNIIADYLYYILWQRVDSVEANILCCVSWRVCSQLNWCIRLIRIKAVVGNRWIHCLYVHIANVWLVSKIQPLQSLLLNWCLLGGYLHSVVSHQLSCSITCMQNAAHRRVNKKNKNTGGWQWLQAPVWPIWWTVKF